MNKEQVVKCRELHKENTMIYLTDGNFYDESREGIYFIWDDSNDLVHVVCSSRQYKTFLSKPVEIITVMYECIDMISRAYNLEDTEKLINNIGGIKNYDTANIMVELKNIAPFSK